MGASGVRSTLLHEVLGNLLISVLLPSGLRIGNAMTSHGPAAHSTDSEPTIKQRAVTPVARARLSRCLFAGFDMLRPQRYSC